MVMVETVVALLLVISVGSYFIIFPIEPQNLEDMYKYYE